MNSYPDSASGIRRRDRRLGAAFGVLCASLLLGLLAGGAGAQEGGGCGSGGRCVLLLEVDGLEPKDITEQNTPVLWSLIHPQSPAGLAIDSTRTGWTWQAPRSVVSAGTLPAAVSLLTGGYPEQTGVPADEFMDEDGGKRRLGALEDAEGNPIGDATPMRGGDLSADPLTRLINENKEDAQAAAFLGNPALAPVFVDDVKDKNPNLFWAPTGENDQQNPPNPAYCPFIPPRTIDPLGDNPQGEFDSKSCIAQDIVTLNKAFNALKDNGAKSPFAYIHLAELAVLKKLAVNDADRVPEPEVFGIPTNGITGTAGDQEDAPTTVASALAQLDASLAAFITQYKQDPNTGPRWQDTVLFIAGSHGYELAPVTHRVPNPGDATDTVENYVEGLADGGKIEMSAQGSMATIYCPGCTDADRADTIANVKAQLEVTVNDGCVQTLNLGPCIDEVLYVNPDLSQQEDFSDTVNGPVPKGFLGCERDPDAPKGRHPTWRYDHRLAEKETVKVENPATGVVEEIETEVCRRTGAGGELLVTLKSPWSFGNAVPGLTDTLVNLGTEITNPYEVTSGGPRNRAIALIVNGPNVRQVQPNRAGGRSPVTKEKTSVEDASQQKGEPVSSDLNVVNAHPEDDADDPGHEAQPITVDVAPTIAALLKVSMPPDQLGGRILQEAFTETLSLPSDEEDLGEPIPDDVAPPVEIIVHPVPGFDFTGLVRAVSSGVSDSAGRAVREVSRRADLHHIRIEGDFGRPDSQIVLTFYEQRTGKGKRERRASTSDRCGSLVIDPVKNELEQSGERRDRGGVRRRSRKCTLETLARFKPFTIGRGHVELRLKVPTRFRPTHVGVTVQEVERLPGFVVKRLRAACQRQQKRKRSKERQDCTVLQFVGSGPRGGGIMILQDAQHLHADRSGRKRRSERRKQRRAKRAAARRARR